MDFTTASMHPLELTVDGKVFVAERLTMIDLAGVAQGMLEAARSEFLKNFSGDEKDRINGLNKIEGPTPWGVVSYLLESFEGMATVVYLALRKKQPEATMEWAAGLTFSDDVIQLCYDLVGVRRRVATRPPAVPAPPPASEPGTPRALTS